MDRRLIWFLATLLPVAVFIELAGGILLIAGYRM